MANYDKRFIRIMNESTWHGSSEIWVDAETGVNYFFHASGYSGGLSPLLGADGRPVVTDARTLEELRYGRV